MKYRARARLFAVTPGQVSRLGFSDRVDKFFLAFILKFTSHAKKWVMPLIVTALKIELKPAGAGPGPGGHTSGIQLRHREVLFGCLAPLMQRSGGISSYCRLQPCMCEETVGSCGWLMEPIDSLAAPSFRHESQESGSQRDGGTGKD